MCHLLLHLFLHSVPLDWYHQHFCPDFKGEISALLSSYTYSCYMRVCKRNKVTQKRTKRRNNEYQTSNKWRNGETTNIKRQINVEMQMAERLKERLTNKQQTHTKRWIPNEKWITERRYDEYQITKKICVICLHFNLLLCWICLVK